MTRRSLNTQYFYFLVWMLIDNARRHSARNLQSYSPMTLMQTPKSRVAVLSNDGIPHLGNLSHGCGPRLKLLHTTLATVLYSVLWPAQRGF